MDVLLLSGYCFVSSISAYESFGHAGKLSREREAELIAGARAGNAAAASE